MVYSPCDVSYKEQKLNQIDNAKFNLAQGLRKRGRPRHASDETRANGYNNELGRYQLVDGLKPWHERVVDTMISNPHAKIVDLAEVFHVTPIWMGQLLKTDAFQEYYKNRLGDHQDLVSKTIVHKMQGVAITALDKMSEEMQGNVPFGQLKDAADLALKGLGFTTQHGPPIMIDTKGGQVTMISVSSEALERARERTKIAMKENTEGLSFEDGNFQQVTSSLELGVEDIDDAVILSPDNPKV